MTAIYENLDVVSPVALLGKHSLNPDFTKCYDSTMSKSVGSTTNYRYKESQYKDWNQRLVKKLDASNFYQLSKFKVIERNPGFWYHRNPALIGCNGKSSSVEFQYTGFPVMGTNVFTGLDLPAYDSELYATASRKLRRKYNEIDADVNLMVPVGEWRSTIDSYNSVVNNTFAYVNRVSHMLDFAKTPKKLVRLLGRAGDMWLQNAFGLQPLLNDVHTAASQVALSLQGHPAFRVSGTAEKQWVTSARVNNTGGDLSTGFTFNEVNRVEHVLKYRLVFGYDAIHPKASNMAAGAYLFETDLREIVLGAYDLFPWTWVLDYFTTTGEWLDGCFNTRLNPIYTTFSQFYSRDHYVDCSPASHYTREISSSGFHYRYINYKRAASANLGQRELRWKTYDEISKYAVHKLLNLGSVLATRVARRTERESIRKELGTYSPYTASGRLAVY